MATRYDRLVEASQPVPAPASLDDPVVVVLSDLIAILSCVTGHEEPITEEV